MSLVVSETKAQKQQSISKNESQIQDRLVPYDSDTRIDRSSSTENQSVKNDEDILMKINASNTLASSTTTNTRTATKRRLVNKKKPLGEKVFVTAGVHGYHPASVVLEQNDDRGSEAKLEPMFTIHNGIKHILIEWDSTRFREYVPISCIDWVNGKKYDDCRDDVTDSKMSGEVNKKNKSLSDDNYHVDENKRKRRTRSSIAAPTSDSNKVAETKCDNPRMKTTTSTNRIAPTKLDSQMKGVGQGTKKLENKSRGKSCNETVSFATADESSSTDDYDFDQMKIKLSACNNQEITAKRIDRDVDLLDSNNKKPTIHATETTTAGNTKSADNRKSILDKKGNGVLHSQGEEHLKISKQNQAMGTSIVSGLHAIKLPRKLIDTWNLNNTQTNVSAPRTTKERNSVYEPVESKEQALLHKHGPIEQRKQSKRKSSDAWIADEFLSSLATKGSLPADKYDLVKIRVPRTNVLNQSKLTSNVKRTELMKNEEVKTPRIEKESANLSSFRDWRRLSGSRNERSKPKSSCSLMSTKGGFEKNRPSLASTDTSNLPQNQQSKKRLDFISSKKENPNQTNYQLVDVLKSEANPFEQGNLTKTCNYTDVARQQSRDTFSANKEICFKSDHNIPNTESDSSKPSLEDSKAFQKSTKSERKSEAGVSAREEIIPSVGHHHSSQSLQAENRNELTCNSQCGSTAVGLEVDLDRTTSSSNNFDGLISRTAGLIVRNSKSFETSSMSNSNTAFGRERLQVDSSLDMDRFLNDAVQKKLRVKNKSTISRTRFNHDWNCQDPEMFEDFESETRKDVDIIEQKESQKVSKQLQSMSSGNRREKRVKKRYRLCPFGFTVASNCGKILGNSPTKSEKWSVPMALRFLSPANLTYYYCGSSMFYGKQRNVKNLYQFGCHIMLCDVTLKKNIVVYDVMYLTGKQIRDGIAKSSYVRVDHPEILPSY